MGSHHHKYLQRSHRTHSESGPVQRTEVQSRGVEQDHGRKCCLDPARPLRRPAGACRPATVAHCLAARPHHARARGSVQPTPHVATATQPGWRQSREFCARHRLPIHASAEYGIGDPSLGLDRALAAYVINPARRLTTNNCERPGQWPGRSLSDLRASMDGHRASSHGAPVRTG
jgi:hypothetical protein